ncbi:MAG: type II toxin-antitoxin system RelE/ParE family toxin [Hyphomicrobiaceae bacterium]
MIQVRKIIRTPRAAEDLIEIYSYIGQHSTRSAESMLLALARQFELLAERPRIGRARPDLRPELRSWPHRSYVILYRTTETGVEIVRVVHGARDLTALLAEQDRAIDSGGGD